MRTEWEPNVRYSGAHGTACRREQPKRSRSVARRRHEAAAARVGRGVGVPVGNVSVALTAPASALSSQSEHRWRTSPPTAIAVVARRHHARRERLRGVVAGHAFDVLAPPFAVRPAHPVADVATAVPDLARSIVTSTWASPCRLIDRAVVGEARPGATERRTGDERLAQLPAHGRLEDRQVRSLGAEQLLAAQRRRAADAIEQPVLVVAQRPLRPYGSAPSSPGRAARRAVRSDRRPALARRRPPRPRPRRPAAPASPRGRRRPPPAAPASPRAPARP